MRILEKWNGDVYLKRTRVNNLFYGYIYKTDYSRDR
ncbi:hypothetical protein JOC76_005949 [Neobacillus cucumis]|nr:hypothetical protein [Neobacillus cucumis]